MEFLEIRRAGGRTDAHPLSQSRAVSIGRTASNDVQIDEEGVGPVHCRVLWNKNRYEVAATTDQGIDCNGTLVRHSVLRPGDVIRVGTVDVVLSNGPSPGNAPAAATDDEPTLQPLSDSERRGGRFGAPAAVRAPVLPPTRPSPPRPPVTQPVAKAAGLPAKESPAKEPEPLDASDFMDGVADDPFDELRDRDRRQSERGPRARDETSEPSHEPPATRLQQGLRKIGAGPVRPGEQDVVRSPFMMLLTAGAVILVVVAVALYFVVTRRISQDAFDAAAAEMEQGKYSQATQLFTAFLTAHPRHALAIEARVNLGKCAVLRETKSGTPNWEAGVSKLQDFIVEHRDADRFLDLQPSIREYAEEIVFGAAKSAEAARSRASLPYALDAQKILDRYPPDEKSAESLRKRIQGAFDAAEKSIRRQETFDAAVASIEASIAAKRTIDALEARRTLLDQYADYADNAKLKTLLGKILETDRELVRREEPDRDALRDDHPAPAERPLVLAATARSRTDEPSVGRTVVVVAQDCCYGVDTVTGEAVWRRVVGFDLPFVPEPVQTSVPAVLVYDANRRELTLLDRAKGTLLWRQPIEDDLQGGPLIANGQIYVAARGGRLLKLDLETGRLVARLTFSQDLLSPPLSVAPGDRLIVAGARELFYSLTTSPLECKRASYLGHRPESVDVPLLEMGPFALMVENDRPGSARLRVFDASAADLQVKQVAEDRVEGNVRDAPVVRGPQLFVPSEPERVAVFQVSNDETRRPLTRIAQQQVPEPRPGPMFLFPGPDNQLYLASSALRRLQLVGDALRLDQGQTAQGRFTQPLQLLDGSFFVARRLPYATATFVSELQRDDLVGQWRTVLGSRWLATTKGRGDAQLVLNETGQVFRFGGERIASGGFERTPLLQLDVPDSVTEPLVGAELGEGLLAVAAAGKPPHLWVINALAQIEREVDLAGPLEAPPTMIEAGIVAPLAGRLKLYRLRGTGTAAEDYQSPIVQGAAVAQWAHVVPLDATQVVAVTDRGDVLRIQHRTAPTPHLAEAAARKLGTAVPWAPLVVSGRVVVADAERRLLALDASSLDLQFEHRLDEPASNPPWSVGDRLYVETGRTRLHCLSGEGPWKSEWTLPLESGGGLAGRPLRHEDKLIVAERSGAVTAVDPATGAALRRIDLGQPLAGGPLLVGGRLVAPTIDGTVARLDAVLQPAP